MNGNVVLVPQALCKLENPWADEEAARSTSGYQFSIKDGLVLPVHKCMGQALNPGVMTLSFVYIPWHAAAFPDEDNSGQTAVIRQGVGRMSLSYTDAQVLQSPKLLGSGGSAAFQLCSHS